MKINQIILTETFDNYLPGDEDKKRLIADEVYQMLQNSYADKGGLIGSGLGSPEEMVQKIPMWKVYRKGNDIKSVILYKDKNGRKGVAMGTDGSREGKIAAGKMSGAEIEQKRSYAEISGAALRMQQKKFGDKLHDYAVPFEKVKQIMPNEEYQQIDDYLYRRKIGGKWHEKMMFGKEGQKIVGKG